MFYREQLQVRPGLPEEHFLELVRDAQEVDVLLITGMRDEAPIATFSHLVPSSKLLEVRVQTSHKEGRPPGECHRESENNTKVVPNQKFHDDRPNFVFHNNHTGSHAAAEFCQKFLLPFIDEGFFQLANMVRSVPDFPCQGMQFRHVLDIAQQPGGLPLCTSLLRKHFTGDWTRIKVIACCEAGGLVFASPLATQIGVPLALIREAKKLPPPTVSTITTKSHISSAAFGSPCEKILELERNLIPKGAPVVVVDDVLATGKTLCAVLTLLKQAGINAEDISIIVVAELPVHRGRKTVREHGFGRTSIQSLLVFDGP
jgi:adenine phosphoribosyltransferase